MDRSPWFLPIVIVAAGAFIAAAIFIVRSGIAHPTASLTALRPVSSNDHIVGNPGADIVIIEYADMDSLYSAQYTQTIESLIAEEGTAGRVAWVFRHFPSTDASADPTADGEAAECAATLGGSSFFFRYLDAVYTYAETGAVPYGPLATSLGISGTDLEACMSAHTNKARVEADFTNGLAIGADGSPFSVLIAKGQEPASISGALTHDALKKIIDATLTKVPQ